MIDRVALRVVAEASDADKWVVKETPTSYQIVTAIGGYVVAEIDASSPMACDGEGECGSQCGEYLSKQRAVADFIAAYSPPTTLALLDSNQEWENIAKDYRARNAGLEAELEQTRTDRDMHQARAKTLSERLATMREKMVELEKRLDETSSLYSGESQRLDEACTKIEDMEIHNEAIRIRDGEIRRLLDD